MKVPEQLQVRSADDDDMPAVAAIFARYVSDTVLTFELEPPTAAAWRGRLASLTAAGWPFLVLVVDGQLVGYAYVSPWRTKPAYAHTVENSIYLDPDSAGRGYGRVLLETLLAAAGSAGARQVIAVIVDSGSPESMSLHRAVGFVQAGRLSQVGFKQDRWLDVVLMQTSLTSGSITSAVTGAS